MLCNLVMSIEVTGCRQVQNLTAEQNAWAINKIDTAVNKMS